MRLAQTYDLDLRDLASADEDRFFAELNEIFSDPLFRQIDLPKQELRDLAELCPGVTHSLQRLYAAYTEARRGETLVAAQMADRDEGSALRGQPDRARPRPDRGQPQLFSRTGAGRGKPARRIERAAPKACSRRSRTRLARKTFDRHPHHAGRRHARDLAAVRPASPAIADFRTGGRTRPRVPARVPDRPVRMQRPSSRPSSAAPARSTTPRAGSTGSRWRIISRPPS